MNSQTAIEVQKNAMFTGHRNSVFALEKSVEPSVFYSAGSDGMVVAWNLNEPDKGKLVAKVPNTVYAMCYVPEQNQLLVGQNTEGVHIIDLDQKTETASIKLTNTAIFSIKYSEGTMYVGTGDGELITVDGNKLAIKKRIKLSDKSLRSLALSPSGKSIAAGYSDHAIRIFSTENMELIHDIPAAHDNSVFSLAYSPNGKFLLSGGRDANLKVWEVSEMYELYESVVGHMYTINDIAFSPSGEFFATCSKDKSIKVWHTASFKLLKVIDKARNAGHGTSVNKLLWLEENHQLISASDDNTVSTWYLTMNYDRINKIIGQ